MKLKNDTKKTINRLVKLLSRDVGDDFSVTIEHSVMKDPSILVATDNDEIDATLPLTK